MYWPRLLESVLKLSVFLKILILWWSECHICFLLMSVFGLESTEILQTVCEFCIYFSASQISPISWLVSQVRKEKRRRKPGETGQTAPNKFVLWILHCVKPICHITVNYMWWLPGISLRWYICNLNIHRRCLR